MTRNTPQEHSPRPGSTSRLGSKPLVWGAISRSEILRCGVSVRLLCRLVSRSAGVLIPDFQAPRFPRLRTQSHFRVFADLVLRDVSLMSSRTRLHAALPWQLLAEGSARDTIRHGDYTSDVTTSQMAAELRRMTDTSLKAKQSCSRMNGPINGPKPKKSRYRCDS